MSLTIRTTTKAEDTADFIASAILKQLKSGKKVLFFVTGGSSIAVGVKVAELLQAESLLENLTITLTDERYGSVDHADSNWHQLITKGFNLPQAKLIPVLTGADIATTTEKWNIALHEEFNKAEYKIGLFGIGSDGHISGILPESVAVYSEDLACTYDTATFSRITTTPKALEKLDEIIVFAQGKEKWWVLENLKNDIDIAKQPAQIIKKVPLVTIFTDYRQTTHEK